MSKLLFLATIAGLAISLVAQSPPPPPSPLISAQRSEQNRGTNEHADTKAKKPTFNPSTAHEKASNNQEREARDATASERIAKFTVVLAIVGGLQVVATVVQAIYMHKGLKVTSDAAGAAKASADAATKTAESILVTERAVVLIDKVSLNTDTLNEFSVFIFTLKNFGQTTAYRVKFSGYFEGLKSIEGKEREFIRETAANTIAPKGKIFWLSRSVNHWLHPTKICVDQINGRQTELTYRLDVTYDDAFKSYIYRCEGRYEPILNEFMVTSSTSD